MLVMLVMHILIKIMFLYLGQGLANITPIFFNELRQSFLATSTPNTESCNNFWMTVSEKQVKFIVNLTSLEDQEGYGYYDDGEIKSEEEYWPFEGTKDLGNGLKIELLSTEKQGSVLKRYNFDIYLRVLDSIIFFSRKLSLFKKDKFIRDIVQISSETSAGDNEEGNFLREILHATLDHCSASSSPIVVQSSTGRVLTGVFIALFKLRDDFYNTG